jgi:hypothetical protein
LFNVTSNISQEIIIKSIPVSPNVTNVRFITNMTSQRASFESYIQTMRMMIECRG